MADPDDAARTERIRRLNDTFRETLSGGRVVMTRGIQALGGRIVAQLIQRIRTFRDFSPDNDPHQEHDFGAVDLDEHQVFWKIDYYDSDLENGSDDPGDPAKTCRVLTILLADEY